MKGFILVLFCASFTGLVSPLPASAHHSIQSEFDGKKLVTISGEIDKVEWINPHSYVTLNVKDADGKDQKWAFEAGGLEVLRKAGLSRADRGGLKPGDAVTVTAMPAKDGSNTGYLREIKTADGRDFKIGVLPTEGEN